MGSLEFFSRDTKWSAISGSWNNDEPARGFRGKGGRDALVRGLGPATEQLFCSRLYSISYIYIYYIKGGKIIENFSHPNQTHLTPHTGPTRHMFLEVDGVGGS
jgi:hypothetical protein